MSSALHLRPRGFSELIDATFQIVRARFGALATGGALIMLPVMALSLLYLLFMPQPQLPITAGDAPTIVPPAVDPPGWIWLLFPVLFVAAIWAFVVGFGAMVHVASRAYLGEAVDFAAGMARARARFWTLLGSAIAKYILFFVLFMGAGLAAAMVGALSRAAAVFVALGLVVASFVLLIGWTMTSPVIINEPATVEQALGRSLTLTRGGRLRLAGIFFVMLVLVWTAMFTLTMTGMLVLRSPMAGQVLGNLASLVMYPFAAVLLTVVYYDLRIRGEGYDLELMAQGLGTEAAARDASLPNAEPAPRQPA